MWWFTILGLLFHLIKPEAHGRYRLAEYASFLTTRRVEFPQPAVIQVKHTSTTWIDRIWQQLIRYAIVTYNLFRRYWSFNEGKSCFITCSSFIIDSMIDLKRSSNMRPLNFARRKMMKTWRSQANSVSEDVILMCWIYPRLSNSHHQDGIPIKLHLPLLLGGGWTQVVLMYYSLFVFMSYCWHFARWKYCGWWWESLEVLNFCFFVARMTKESCLWDGANFVQSAEDCPQTSFTPQGFN